MTYLASRNSMICRQPKFPQLRFCKNRSISQHVKSSPKTEEPKMKARKGSIYKKTSVYKNFLVVTHGTKNTSRIAQEDSHAVHIDIQPPLIQKLELAPILRKPKTKS